MATAPVARRSRQCFLAPQGLILMDDEKAEKITLRFIFKRDCPFGERRG
jgi:hypothetical protein